MKQRRVTKPLIKRIIEVTNTLFKQSVIEIMDAEKLTEEELQDLINDIRRAALLMHHIAWYDDAEMYTNQELIKKKELIDELYLVKMIQLPTKDLNDILFLHEAGKPRRSIRTLEAITSELARRSILDDSSQSDAMYSNGDVNAGRKSKGTGKKASSKKHKATKV